MQAQQDPSPRSVAAMPPSQESFTQDEEDDELVLLDSLSKTDSKYCRIVGIRYYRGEAHPGEFVNLCREPHNPYDRNAIRVDNMHHEKVGHIKRELAAVLAPLMDRYALTMDASIPGPGNHYELPLHIDFRTSATIPQGERQVVGNQLQEALSRVRFRKTKPAKIAPAPASVQVSTKKIDWKTQQKHLDDMFAEQTKKQLENLPEIQLPQTLTATLLEHQVEGVRWLYQREQGNQPPPFYKQVQERGQSVWLCEITQASQTSKPSIVRGGILADDMGLGKTIQTLALILSNPPPGRDYNVPLIAAQAAAAAEASDSNAEVSFPEKKPTKTAIKKVKLPQLQNVLMEAGLAVATKKSELVTAVQNGLDQGTITVQQYYSAIAKPPPAKSTPADTASKPPVTTLIVAPVSVLSNWTDQVGAHVQPNTLRVAYYHGTDRKDVLEHLDEIDVLISSYNTLQYDYTNETGTSKAGQPPAPKKFKRNSIFSQTFHRIILDEAHIVRNSKSRTFQACAALQADRRLCLTGTPLQNKPEDIQSLLHFLQMPPVREKDVFRRAIAQPIKDGDDTGLSRLRALMAHVALRRNKSMVNIDLPNKVVELRAVTFAEGNPHCKIYNTIYESAKRVFQTLHSGGDGALSQNGACIFEILTRLRQACCSGKLVPVERLRRAEQVMATLESKDDLSVEEANQLLEKLKGALDQDSDDGPIECAICMEQMNESAAVILRGCGHVFCQVCIARVAEGHHSLCPFCRKSFGPEDIVKWNTAEAASAANKESAKEPALSEQMDELGPSPKMEALLLAIGEMKEGEKGVIFSQFTKFLDEIEKHLESKNLTFARIDGSKSTTQRSEAMRSFAQEESGPQFMLCSLHAAGTGINLTRANHVFMMDTWFTKGVELQGMDRVHRIGQSRDVRVVRFVAADSVESRMVDLQEAKAALGKGVFENLSSEEKRAARLGDLKRLLELN